jgi:hypothetical protein
MPGRLGPRFAIEALFLITLAAGVAYADLSRKWIAIVMAGGWVVVALLELTADRIWAAAPPWRRPDYFAAPMPRTEAVAAPAPAPEPVHRPEPKPEPQPAPEPELEPEPEPVPAAEEPEAATVIAQRTEPPAQEPEPEPAGAAVDERPRPKLEPLDARPKRRWFRREAEEVPDETTEIPLPKHVRLLPASERQAAPDDVGELLNEPEENTSA